MERDGNWYVAKQDRLNLTKERIDKKLAEFKHLAETNFYEPYDKISEEERQKWRDEMETWLWNDWHSLDTRIENRIADNYMDYNQWHFDTFDWVAL